MAYTLDLERALNLDEQALQRELEQALAENPALCRRLDPYADGTELLLRDRLSAALSLHPWDNPAQRRLRLHRALSNQTTDQFATRGPGLPDLVDVNPITAAAFLDAIAEVGLPWSGGLKLPALPVIVPTITTGEKVSVASGGQIGGSLDTGPPFLSAWGCDMAMQVYERQSAAWLRVLFQEVGAAVYAVADQTALAEVAGTPGIGAATDMFAAVGTVIAAQPSARPVMVVLPTSNVGAIVGLRELLEAGLVRMVIAPGLLAVGTAALVIGGQAVIATRTNLEVIAAVDVDLIGRNVVWFVEFNLAVRAPAAVVVVSGP